MAFENKINLANIDLGANVVWASDDFFAEANRMLAPSDAVFIEDKYDDNGKWMDGWETRRRRDGQNDYCFVALGGKSTIDSFDVDTSHFTGNYAPAVSIMGYCASEPLSADKLQNTNLKWVNLVSPYALSKDSHHLILNTQTQAPFTHLKVTIYPDGGIARLRVFGNLCFDDDLYQKRDINVIAAKTGARAIYANDEHFGRLGNILNAHEPKNMGDGWETRRRREPGNDWGLIALARPAVVGHLSLDTKFFKGNFPDRFSICAAYIDDPVDEALIVQSMFWSELLPEQSLSADREHYFGSDKLLNSNPITHIKLNIFPDGGVSRLKLFGHFIRL